MRERGPVRKSGSLPHRTGAKKIRRGDAQEAPTRRVETGEKSGPPPSRRERAVRIKLERFHQGRLTRRSPKAAVNFLFQDLSRRGGRRCISQRTAEPSRLLREFLLGSFAGLNPPFGTCASPVRLSQAIKENPVPAEARTGSRVSSCKRYGLPAKSVLSPPTKRRGQLP